MICELLAIAALMILLVIEAQHSPHFVKFAAIAMAGAGAVLLLTFVRWQSERNRDQVKDRPSVTDVVPATSILPSRHASKSSYRDLARRSARRMALKTAKWWAAGGRERKHFGNEVYRGAVLAISRRSA